jgi:hypothetical protein
VKGEAVDAACRAAVAGSVIAASREVYTAAIFSTRTGCPARIGTV